MAIKAAASCYGSPSLGCEEVGEVGGILADVEDGWSSAASGFCL